MKIDLSKVLAVSGQRGLFLYVGQARNGVIVENLQDKKRQVFNMNSKITSLSDISIYTEEEELKLQELFIKMKEHLAGEKVLSSKSDDKSIKAFFDAVVPDYDKDRFYVSHMKKILDWYGGLESADYLDFETEEEAEQK